MPWVDFAGDFTWRHPGARVRTTAYKAGHLVLVSPTCALAAAAAGAGAEVKTPTKAERERLAANGFRRP